MANRAFFKKAKTTAPEPVMEKPKMVSAEPFITTDSKLVEKLQDKFSIKSISYNKETELRLFTFNATRQEVEEYIKTHIGGQDANAKL